MVGNPVPVLLLLIAGQAWAESCPEGFASLENAQYRAVPRVQEALKQAYGDALKRKPWVQFTKLNQSGQFKRWGQVFELQLPILVYGGPYRHQGREYVDFELPSDKLETVLRRMPYEEFEARVLPKFLERLLEKSKRNQGEVFLLPREKSGGKRASSVLDAYELVGVDPRREDWLEVRAIPGGEKRSVPARELLRADLVPTAEEKSLAKSFFGAGGKGDLVRLSHLGSPLEHGVYLAVRKLPEARRVSGEFPALSDPFMRAELEDYLGKGAPLVLGESNHGFAGAVMPAKDRFNASLQGRARFNLEGKPVLVVTPNVDLYSLRHERRHWEDDSAKLLGQIDREIMRLKAKGAGSLSEEEARAVSLYAAEQRAYSRQLASMTADFAAQPERQVPVRTPQGTVSVPFQMYFEYHVQRALQHAQVYSDPVKALLARVQGASPGIYEELRALLRRHASSELEVLDLSRTFPEHF